MKHLTLLTCLALFTTLLSAQDLHIYYDAQNDSLWYMMDGQSVSRPKVRRNSNVFVHVENFNNYIYNSKIEADDSDLTTPSATGGSLTTLFPSLGGNGSSLLTALTGTGSRGLTDGTITTEQVTTTSRAIPKSFDDAERNAVSKLKAMVSRFEQRIAAINSLDVALENKQLEVKSILEAHQIRGVVLQELEAVKYDVNLKPAGIKKMSKEYLQKVLNADSPEDINLNALIQTADTRGQLSQKLNDVKQQHQQYDAAVAQLVRLKDSIELFNNDPDLIPFTLPVVQSYDQVSNFDNTYNKLEQDMDAAIRELQDTDILKLTAMWRAYEALEGNTFSRTHRTVARGDQLSVTVKLDPTEAARTQAKTATLVQTAPIEVPIFGGFKVNASIGVAFGQLFDRGQAFFVRDSLIRSEDKDSFSPIVASFFHFYGQTAGNVSLGGSFGIGLPIGGTANAQSASFFGGPSLIIGRGERIVLTGGLMGTRVERLGQGYEVGDRFISPANNVPLKQVYELGYFLGFSFNVLGGGPR